MLQPHWKWQHPGQTDDEKELDDWSHFTPSGCDLSILYPVDRRPAHVQDLIALANIPPSGFLVLSAIPPITVIAKLHASGLYQEPARSWLPCRFKPPPLSELPSSKLVWYMPSMLSYREGEVRRGFGAVLSIIRSGDMIAMKRNHSCYVKLGPEMGPSFTVMMIQHILLRRRVYSSIGAGKSAWLREQISDNAY
jgi:hypothetical protein